MQELSIYRRCSRAARRLLEDPALRITTTGPDGIWTELDVYFLANRELIEEQHPQWDEEEQRHAVKQASGVMTRLFGTHRVVRFGPVYFGDEPDYARTGSQIIYARADDLEYLDTPNGRIPRMFYSDDAIKRPGRRFDADRDDLEPWAGQIASSQPATAEQVQLLSVTAERDVLLQRVVELETEVHRLRRNGAGGKNRDEIAQDGYRASARSLDASRS